MDLGGAARVRAAALYGVGTRLDDRPELLFTLRGVDHIELIERAGDVKHSQAGMDAGAGVAVIMLLAWTVLTTILVARHGQTVGKKLVGIKVVRSDGSRAGINRLTWLRNVVVALPSLLPVVGLVAGPIFWIVDSLFIFGHARQCLHDRIADTIVIRA
jgi:hypothetical protein